MTAGKAMARLAMTNTRGVAYRMTRRVQLLTGRRRRPAKAR